MPDKPKCDESNTGILRSIAERRPNGNGNGNGNGRRPLGPGSAVQLGLLISLCAGCIALTAWEFTQHGHLAAEDARIERRIDAVEHHDRDCDRDRARLWQAIEEVKKTYMSCKDFKAIRDATEAWNKGIGFVAPPWDCK